MSFSSQLESVGLWHWAMFVVLHLENSHSRESAVKDLLYRNIKLSHDPNYKEQETFLKERLGLPSQWIHYAKVCFPVYNCYCCEFIQWILSDQVVHVLPKNDQVVHVLPRNDQVVHVLTKNDQVVHVLTKSYLQPPPYLLLYF